MEAFLGEIKLFGGNFAPKDWALCDGQLVAISQNQALYAILGTTYGGDGRTTFGLPDFRGRVPVGLGRGPGLLNYVPGRKAGVEGVILDQTQMPKHNHGAALSSVSVKVMASSEVGTESVPGSNDARTLGATKAAIGSSDKLYNSDTATIELSGVTTNGGIVTVQNTGGDMYHENRQPYLVTNYIICTDGIFPSRN